MIRGITVHRPAPRGAAVRRAAVLLSLLLLAGACGGGAGDDAAGGDTATEDAGGDTATTAASEESAAGIEEASTDEASAGEATSEEASSEEATGEASAAAGGEDFTIGVSNLGLSFPFPASIGEGIQARAEELGVELVELDAAGDADQQANTVQDLIAQEVDGVLLLPVDSGVAEGLVDDLAAAGIPVVAVASQVGDPTEREIEDVYPGLVALVTQAEVEAGEKAAAIALDVLPDGGQVAIVEGAAGFAEVQTRAVGFEEVLGAAEATYEIVARQPGDWTPEAAEAACQNMLASNPDIALFYAQSDDMSVGCAQAIEAAGSDAQTIGIGGSGLGVGAIEDGTVAGTVCYKPVDMGELAMQTIYDHLTGVTTETGQFITYDTPAITAENVADCEPQW